MTAEKHTTNPLYLLAVAAGTAFAVTAFAYGVMTINMIQPEGAARVRESPMGLLPFLDKHGILLMSVEIVVLGAFTFAAMATDDYWMRRAARRERDAAKK